MVATADLDLVVSSSNFLFICVPTPNKNGSIDLTYVKDIVASATDRMRETAKYRVLVVKSTVTPTSTEKTIIPIIRKNVGKDFKARLGLCVNPEFITEAHGSWTSERFFAKTWASQDRIVIGELDKRSGDALQSLYKPINIPIIRTDLTTAEMIKYASNCALAARISYWNEIHYISRILGINSTVVAQVAGMDARVGEYGTVHGKAFGGKCLPKDLQAFIDLCEKSGYEPKLLKAVNEINERIRFDNGVRE
jgi:nucleotide sugar dehydrogenase